MTRARTPAAVQGAGSCPSVAAITGMLGTLFLVLLLSIVKYTSRSFHFFLCAMDFVSATDRLTACPSHADIAYEAGVSVQAIRQARMYPQAEGYRSPPSGWEAAVARLARSRAEELMQLAEQLEG